MTAVATAGHPDGYPVRIGVYINASPGTWYQLDERKYMHRLIAASTAAFFGSTISPVFAQEDVAELVERIGPSVVMIKTFDSGGQPFGQGSGFFLEDGRIVTNTHVIQGAARAEILDSTGRLVGIATYVEAVSTTADLAILPRVATEVRGLTLAADAEPRVGSRIIVIGAPEGFRHTVSDGLVNAVRDVDSQRLIQISAPISQGSSGGPVLNMSGEVVGVTVMSFSSGQNLNFAVPAQTVGVLAATPPEAASFASVSATGVPGTLPRGSLIEAGQTVRGALHEDLPQLSDGSYYETSHFNGLKDERYRISMKSDAFDAFLILGRIVDGRFVAIARGDDGPMLVSRDARINITLPEDGEYVIYATSFRPFMTGAYQLTLERR